MLLRLYRCALILLPLFFSTTLTADFRDFVGKNGNAIHAEIVDLRPNMVELRLDTGQKFTVPYSEFSEADQRYLKEEYKLSSQSLYTESAKVDIRVQKGIRSKDIPGYSSSDYEQLSMSPEVIFNNRELAESFTGVTGEIVLLGKEMVRGSDRRKVLLKDSFVVDLPRNAETRWHSSKQYSGRTYDSRYSSYAFGFEYYAYALIVKNRKGEIVYQEIPSSIKDPGLVSTLKEGVVYDRTFKYEDNSVN